MTKDNASSLFGFSWRAKSRSHHSTKTTTASKIKILKPFIVKKSK